MIKLAMGIEYDGSQFHGWQSQKHAHSVQEAIEMALSRVAAEPIKTICAGRTDQGVHALGQVIHFETKAIRSAKGWLFGANSELPKSVRVLWVKEVPLEFNARRSAFARRYQYVIYNHPIRPSLFGKQLSWCYRKLEAPKMVEAVQYWLGEHDFSSFRASSCQSRSPIRQISDISVKRAGDFILIDVTANAFLHHMVRNMMGVLMLIGSGKAEPIWAQKVLETKDRRQAGMTAAPNGLYLAQVFYPEHFGLPLPLKSDPWFLNMNEEVY